MADWWARGRDPILQDEAEVDTADLADSAVETVKLADLNVTSEKISANALRRSVVVPLPDLTAGSTAPLTSDHGVWTPSKAVKLAGFALWMQTSWVMTTVQTTGVGTLYNGAGDALGTVSVPSTDPPARGVRLAGVLSTALSIAAAQTVTFGLTGATSSGWDQPDMALQLDWDSTE